MSNWARVGLLFLTAILAVAAFFVFRPAEESRRSDDGGSQTTAPATAGGAPPASTTGDPEAQPPPALRVEEVRIENGRPVGEPATLRFDSGETVRIAFRSDAAGEVHIHGYDRYVQLRPGRTVRTRFTANLEGIFEIENHDNGELLAELRVEP